MAYSDYDDSHQKRNLTLKCPFRHLHTLRILLRLEVEQRMNNKFIRFKAIKLHDIHHKLTLVFDEEACTLASVKDWIHELKTDRIIMTDNPRRGRLSSDDIEVLLLKQLSETPFASVRSLSCDLKIPKTMVWLRLTEYFQLKSRHLKWVPFM
jgi:hypothetical protein